jgi:S-adenosylmethionine decarboxylase
MRTSFPFHVATLYGCGEAIGDAPGLMTVLEEAATAAHCTIVGRLVAHYQAHGMTLVLLLAESHFLVTTWPEYGVVVAEAMLCNGWDPAGLFERLKESLGATRISTTRVPIELETSPESWNDQR